MATDRKLVRELKLIAKEELNLDGQQLIDFVERRISEIRDEKRIEKETEMKKIELERLARDRELDRQREIEEREKQTEEKKEQLAREERERDKEREYQLALERIRLEGESRNQSRDERLENSTHRPNQVTMPIFNEKEELIDCFLAQFEKLASTYQLPQRQWAISVSAFLQGDARAVYHNLPLSEADDYDALKAALLKHYELSAESFRKQFRASTKKDNETHAQFHGRVRVLFDKWVKMSNTPATFEGLRELVLKEHVLGTYRKDLTVFLAEREFSTLEEMGAIAERFDNAHSQTSIAGRDRQGNGKYKKFKERATHVGNDRNGGKHVVEGTSQGHTRGWEKSQSFERDTPGRKGVVVCFRCNKQGHLAKHCRSPQSVSVGVAVTATKSVGVKGRSNRGVGKVNGREVSVLYDTGCDYPVLVKSEFVRPEDFTGEVVEVAGIMGEKGVFRIAYVDLDTLYVKGRVKAACNKVLPQDVVLGCKYVLPQPVSMPCEIVHAGAVETRSMKSKSGTKPLKSTTLPIDNLLPGELGKFQEEDETLAKVRGYSADGSVRKLPDGEVKFGVKRGILYRFVKKETDTYKQLVVPLTKRVEVLRLAHEGLLGSHMGVAKTLDRVRREFYWPGIHGDVRRYCLSCDKCQRVAPKTSHRPVPLGTTPIIDEPFSRVAMDLVGPIVPSAESGNRYILTIVDYATRYPEAVALKNIDSVTVAEALLGVWSRVGVPEEILTDQGTQFVSQVMEEVNRLLSIRHLTTTPYHPQCNGLVERFNGTLKQALKKLCEGRPRDWDRYLPAILFAYREVPQTSMGFSPFELVYGRTVRGPLAVLKQLWTDERACEEVKTTYQYVTDLRNKLEEVCQLANENLRGAKGRQARYYNKKAKERHFEIGDKVLLLLPLEHNKLQVSWRGPFEVTERKSGQTYRIRVGDKEKLYHVNLLKRYRERECPTELVVATVVTEENHEDVGEGDVLPSCPLTREETRSDVVLGNDLRPEQQKDVESLLEEYSSVLTEVPGRTELEEFTLTLIDDKPVKLKPYPLPYAKLEVVRKEIRDMMTLGVIEPAESAYSSPVVLVQKKDGKHRFCVDYRKLNQVSEFQVELLPDPEAIFAKVSHAKYFTKIDLSKGYWQIPVRLEDRPKLAFATPDGTYQWVVMPFGVQNAPSVFTRMMRKLLEPLSDVGVFNFMDDLLIATATWEEHICLLRNVLQRLRQTGLTARPSKCHVGFKELPYLGHTLGAGMLKPEEVKVNQLRNAKQPVTKTEVRSFLGLAGYYRKFVANFSAIAGPLTDLTRKKAPTNVVWTDACERAFQTLKDRLTSDAVVKLPDLSKEFVLRTDACDQGLGAVLLQEHGGKLFPVAYGSRKLSSAERNYSVSEKECLAIVFGINKFQRYLYGRKFVLETDHQPLAYLAQAKLTNGRLMRWSLFLQQYKVHVRYIKGVDNVGADCLSRLG